MQNLLNSDPELIKAVAWAAPRLLPQEEFVIRQIVGQPRYAHDFMESMRPTWTRVSKASLSKAVFKAREALRDFSQSSEGIGFTQRFSILGEGKPWTIGTEQNTLSATAQFWFDHLRNGRRTCIVLGEPPAVESRGISTGVVWESALSVRPKPVRPKMVRRDGGPEEPEDSSVEAEAPPVTKPHVDPVEALLLGDPFRKVRLGDVRASLALYSYFMELHNEGIGYPEPDVISMNDANRNQDNLIVLGSTTKDSALFATTWNRHFNLALTDGNMLLEKHVGGEKTGRGQANYPTSCFVLVSRCVLDGRAVTLITGGHPAAVHEIGRLLTNEKRVEKEVIVALKLPKARRGFPSEFQIVFAIHLTKDERTVERIEADCFRTLEKIPIPPGRAAMRIIE